MEARTPDRSTPDWPANDLLESWKAIASYLKRDARTIQRWEQRRRLPIHRIPGGGKAAVFALKTELDSWRQGAAKIRAAPAGLSIAVLPFANLGSTKGGRYFADALADEIITDLTQLPGLQVTAWTSSAAYRDAAADVTEIGARLHAGMLLEGGVRLSGKRLRVWAQLVETATGYHLWSERYDQDLTDEFGVQESVARAIFEAVSGRLGIVPCEKRI